jgi:hypothetical protein
MTVSSSTNSASYSGNGSTTVFAYAFKIFEDSDLTVTLVNDTTGVETAQTLTTHYTVSGAGTNSGGNVTFVAAPASGNTVKIKRSLAFTQTTTYTENDAFPAKAHEDGLDRLTMLTQQSVEDIDSRAPKASPTFTGTVSIGDLDIYEDGSNSVIKEDGTGSLLIRGTSLSLQASDNANYVQCIDEGAVTLFHNAAPKLATTSAGVDVTGRLSTGDIRVTVGIDNINPYAPHAGSSGTAGDLHFSSNYIYVCVATNTWKRVAISTWDPEF